VSWTQDVEWHDDLGRRKLQMDAMGRAKGTGSFRGMCMAVSWRQCKLAARGAFDRRELQIPVDRSGNVMDDSKACHKFADTEIDSRKLAVPDVAPALRQLEEKFNVGMQPTWSRPVHLRLQLHVMCFRTMNSLLIHSDD
jgi:hypothetical protein